MRFQDALELANYEVCIELYTDDGHYMVHKPDSPTNHCWEVLRLRGMAEDEEVRMDCDTLDDAFDAIVKRNEQLKAGRRIFEDAMDEVCLECLFHEGCCATCPVTKTYESIRKR